MEPPIWLSGNALVSLELINVVAATSVPVSTWMGDRLRPRADKPSWYVATSRSLDQLELTAFHLQGSVNRVPACLAEVKVGPLKLKAFYYLSTVIVRENVRNTAKNVKSHDFLDFEKP